MQIAILNTLSQTVVDKIDAPDHATAAKMYLSQLADEYGFDTVDEFINQYRTLCQSLFATVLH